MSVGWLSCTWVNFWPSVDAFTDWAAAFVGELLPVQRRWRGYEAVWMGEHGVMVGARLRQQAAPVVNPQDTATQQAAPAVVALHAEKWTSSQGEGEKAGSDRTGSNEHCLSGVRAQPASLGVGSRASAARWNEGDQTEGERHRDRLQLLESAPCESPPLELHLDIPATVLEALTPEALYALLEVVCQAQNITRADVTLDDWAKLQTPLGLELLTSGGPDPYALNKESLVTHAATSNYRRSKGPTGGDSWNLGATSGLAQLRVYDKARESAGQVDAIRWELQLRGERAKSALLHLFFGSQSRGGASGVSNFMGEWAASELVRFVDFRNRSDDSNISRCGRLGWWAALVLNAEKARSVTVPAPLTVERLHDYAERALPSLLATLADSARLVAGVSPEAWLLGMLVDGRRRRSPRHRLALNAAGVGPVDIHA